MNSALPRESSDARDTKQGLKMIGNIILAASRKLGQKQTNKEKKRQAPNDFFLRKSPSPICSFPNAAFALLENSSHPSQPLPITAWNSNDSICVFTEEGFHFVFHGHRNRMTVPRRSHNTNL